MVQVVCTGCGAELQSTFVDQPGYVPTGAPNRDDVVCRRCFRIRNYGEFSRVEVSPELYAEQVSKILHNPGLVLYVLDVFDLEGSLVKNLARYIGKSPVILVVNKIDLLPREVKVDALSSWVRETVEGTGVSVTDVVFVSGQSQAGIAEVLGVVDERATDKVYVVGMANVGKSTLLNGIITKLGERERFTASRVPGTTLGLVETTVQLPSGRSLTLVDTPGLIHGDRVLDKLCTNCLKIAVPRTRLRPRVFQLNPEQSLWLGGFARFDFISGSRQSVVCYVSNELTIHRTKLERAEYIGREHVEDILKVPCAECRSHFGEHVKTTIATARYSKHVEEPRRSRTVSRNGCDIVLPGLGWISLMGNDFFGAVWAPGEVPIRVRPRMIGDISRSVIR